MGQATSKIEHIEEDLPELYYYNQPEDVKDEESVCNITDHLKGLVPDSYITEETAATVTRKRTVQPEVPKKKTSDDSLTMSDAYYKGLTYLPTRHTVNMGTPSPQPIDRDDPDYLDLGFEEADEEARRITERTYSDARSRKPALLDEFVEEAPVGSFKKTMEEDAARNKKDYLITAAPLPTRTNSRDTVDDITQRQKENFSATLQTGSSLAQTTPRGKMEYSQDYLLTIANAAAQFTEKSITPPVRAPEPAPMPPSMYPGFPYNPAGPYGSYPGFHPYAGYPYPYYPGAHHHFDPMHPMNPHMLYGQHNNHVMKQSQASERQEAGGRAPQISPTQYDPVHETSPTPNLQTSSPKQPSPGVMDLRSPSTKSTKATGPAQTQYDPVCETTPENLVNGSPKHTGPTNSPNQAGPTQYDPVYQGTSPGTNCHPSNQAPLPVSPRSSGINRSPKQITPRAKRAETQYDQVCEGQTGSSNLSGPTQYDPVCQGTSPGTNGHTNYKAQLSVTPRSSGTNGSPKQITPRAQRAETQYDQVCEELPENVTPNRRSTRRSDQQNKLNQIRDPPVQAPLPIREVVRTSASPKQTQYDSVAETAPGVISKGSPQQTQYAQVAAEEEFDEIADDEMDIEPEGISSKVRPQATQYDEVHEEIQTIRIAHRPQLNRAIKSEMIDRVNSSFDTELNRSCTIPYAGSSCGSQMNGTGVFDTVAEDPVVQEFKKPILKPSKLKTGTITDYFRPPVPRRISSLSTDSVPIKRPEPHRVQSFEAKQVVVQLKPLELKRVAPVLQEVHANLENQKRRKTLPTTSTPLPHAVPFIMPESPEKMAPQQLPNLHRPGSFPGEAQQRSMTTYFETLARQIMSPEWNIHTVKDIWEEACRNVEQRRYQQHFRVTQPQVDSYHHKQLQEAPAKPPRNRCSY